MSSRPIASNDEMLDFHIAAKIGETATVRDFIDRYGPVVIDEKDERGMTALMWAARGNQPETIETLLKYGADLDKRDDSRLSALMWAAFSGSVEAMTFLLDKGAAFDRDGILDMKLVKEAQDIASDTGLERLHAWIEAYERQKWKEVADAVARADAQMQERLRAASEAHRQKLQSVRPTKPSLRKG